MLIENYKPDEFDWEESTPVTSIKPSVSYQEIAGVYYIFDSAGEAIDSTRNPAKVEGLLKHWREFLGRKR